MAEIKKAAIVAAKWWTDIISSPNLNSFNNGDRTSESSFFVMMLAHMNAMNHVATQEQLDKFNEILSKKISDELDSSSQVDLDCDYGPCVFLGEAAEEAGIDISLFPYKRMMWITCTSVEVKDGYGAEVKIIYRDNAESTTE